LNNFAALPEETRKNVRRRIIHLLETKSSELFQNTELNKAAFLQAGGVTMHVPMQIGDFTDFMCSRTHGDNVSILEIMHFRI
jgi:fumarylacetoacetase